MKRGKEGADSPSKKPRVDGEQKPAPKARICKACKVPLKGHACPLKAAKGAAAEQAAGSPASSTKHTKKEEARFQPADDEEAAGAAADDNEIYHESSDEDEIEHVDDCIECGDGGKLMCCESCPRAYHPQCVEFRGVPGGDWWCPTCLRASKAGTNFPKSRYRVDGAAVMAVERLCAAFPPSHFLSVRATQLQTVRKLMQTCRALGIETPGIRHLTDEASVIRQLKSILSGHGGGGEKKAKKAKKAQAAGTADEGAPAAAAQGSGGGASDVECAASSSSSSSSSAGGGGMPPVPTLTPVGGAPDSAALTSQFTRYGYCLLSDAGFSQAQGDALHDEVSDYFNRVIYTVNIKSMQDVLTDTGFRTFKLRQRGRYDMVDPALAFATHTPPFSFLHTSAAWLPLVRQILGDDCECIHVGCMLSMPGSEVQEWHSDGDHESNERHLTPHCLNVFVPLVQVTAANGGTELVPTSHIFRNYGTTVDSVTPMPGLGQALIFDYRLKHRGLGNSSQAPRPILYITYATKAFATKAVAHANYSARRYRDLPALCDLPLSRQARAAKRASETTDAGGSKRAPELAGRKVAASVAATSGVKRRPGRPRKHPLPPAPPQPPVAASAVVTVAAAAATTTSVGAT
jgi:hypothetical protein